MSSDKKVTDILRPKKQTTALVFDSPHSGNVYPDDFLFSSDMSDLRMAEDMYVDELFADVPQYGAPLLKALFPRSYIDPNRALPSQKDDSNANDNIPETTKQRGLCRIVCSGINNTPIYDDEHLPSNTEKSKRIEDYYKKYHENLSDIISTTRGNFDHVLHINCHSMPSMRGNGTKNAYDIILGNRDGRTCSAEVMDFIKTTLEDMGYTVGINIKGYRGAEIVRRYGKPEDDQHSVQFEINRALYMDERKFDKTKNFNALKRDLKTLCAKLSTFTPQKAPSKHVPRAQKRPNFKR